MSDDGSSGEDGSVVGLARRATEAFNPAEGLSAVVELRDRLDAVETAYVEDAVYEGWSWQRIADYLGVSRQAAHRRHAKSLKAKRRRRLRDRVTFSPAIARIVRRATAEAQMMGHRSVDEGHLLLGLVCENSVACTALTESGTLIPRLREQITRLHGGSQPQSGTAALNADPPPATDEALRLRLTALARRALRESVDAAARLHSREVHPEHLLVALLRPSEGPVAKLLLRLGLRAEELRDEVQGELQPESTR